ncbi:MAG: hypothetical protein ACQGVK_13035 [Myxococcota bacterium]
MTDPEDRRRLEPDSLGELVSGERLRSLLVHEPGLWPVAIVLCVVAVTLSTSLLTLALRSRSVFAAAVVALLVLMSVMAVDGSRRKRGRFGPALWIALAFWGATGAATLTVLRWGGG